MMKLLLTDWVEDRWVEGIDSCGRRDPPETHHNQELIDSNKDRLSDRNRDEKKKTNKSKYIQHQIQLFFLTNCYSINEQNIPTTPPPPPIPLST
jgi:hypothetical protein